VNVLHCELLTSRETEVLNCMARGLRDKEIARELYLSVRTINCYAVRIFAKFDVKNRAAAVEAARRQGLLSSHV
jgi:DNA-binding NarL/FixJ family response regulator